MSQEKSEIVDVIDINFVAESILISTKQNEQSRVSFDDIDLLSYLGFSDTNLRELYEGDVIELTIVPEMRDTDNNSFCRSNFSEYICKNKDITSVLIKFDLSRTLSFEWKCYLKRNEKLEYYEGTNKAVVFNRNTDNLFPRYLIEKGAAFIGNVKENPFLIDKVPEFAIGKVFPYYLSDDDYRSFVVLDKTEDSVKILSLLTGKEYTKSILELVNGDDDIEFYGDISLNQFISYSRMVERKFTSNMKVVEFYKKHFEFTEEDDAYLNRMEEKWKSKSELN